MARFAFFHDTDAEAIRLTVIQHDGAVASKAENFSGLAPDGRRLLATRMIELKNNPSRHECGAACLQASGKVMRCECSCGGKNHGRGR